MSSPTPADLARAVILYHGPDKWTDEKQREWNRLTGEPEDSKVAMSTRLLEMANAVLETHP